MKLESPIVLTGMKHTGKSTIGTLLAKELAYTFFDTDIVIAEIAGKSARELYDSGGSQLMQEFETQALKHLFSLEQDSRMVIATGGGLADNKEALDIINEKGRNIYLDTPFELLFSRIMHSANRDGRLPQFLQGGDPQSLFLDLFSRRSTIYATICDIVIHTGALNPPEIVRTILEYLA